MVATLARAIRSLQYAPMASFRCRPEALKSCNRHMASPRRATSGVVARHKRRSKFSDSMVPERPPGPQPCVADVIGQWQGHQETESERRASRAMEK